MKTNDKYRVTSKAGIFAGTNDMRRAFEIADAHYRLSRGRSVAKVIDSDGREVRR